MLGLKAYRYLSAYEGGPFPPAIHFTANRSRSRVPEAVPDCGSSRLGAVVPREAQRVSDGCLQVKACQIPC